MGANIGWLALREWQGPESGGAPASPRPDRLVSLHTTEQAAGDEQNRPPTGGISPVARVYSRGRLRAWDLDVPRSRPAVFNSSCRRFCRAQQREKDNIADGVRIGQEHGQAVDADAFPARRRHAVTERADVILIDGVRRKVALLAQELLILEAVALFGGIVQLTEGVRNLHAADVKLEALDEIRVVGFLLRER